MKNSQAVLLSIKEKQIQYRSYTFTEAVLHWHTFYEFEIYLEGDGELKVNGRCYKIEPGTVSFMRTTDFQEINLRKKAKIRLVQISPELMPEELRAYFTSYSGDFVKTLNREDFDRIMRILDILEAELNIDPRDKFTFKSIEHISFSLLSVLLRCFDLENEAGGVSVNKTIYPILSYINEHFRENITVEEIAAKFFLNSNYFCSLFRKETGSKCGDYIRNLRMNHAVRLVTLTKLSITDISGESGYNSISSFLRDFKKHFGVSPTKMRKDNPQKKDM